MEGVMRYLTLTLEKYALFKFFLAIALLYAFYSDNAFNNPLRINRVLRFCVQLKKN